MLTMNELIDLRMQQQIAHEMYRQQIMQRIPDPFPPMLPFHMPHHIIVSPRPPLPGVEAKLENNELWRQFHKIGTEMIITKCGRRMFPSMRVSVSGLEDETNYCVLLEMVPIGDCRYKFSGSHWIPAGGAEPQSPQRMFLHPDSPATGAHWQSQAIIFNKVKLTNNTLDSNGHIVLASMHKYQPRLHIIRTSDLTQLPWAAQQAFVFPETEFVAVTAYQNDRITKLKIDNNPFAKGFRETGQSRCKRKLSALNVDEEDTGDNTQRNPSSSDDDRSAIINDQMHSPTSKRARSNGSCDDDSYVNSIGSQSCGSLSPYYDDIMYPSMYQRESLQQPQQNLNLSPTDIAAATYFAAITNINPVMTPVNGMQPLLMQMSHPLHAQTNMLPSQSHYLQQASSTSSFTHPIDLMRTSTAGPHLQEEQRSTGSALLSEEVREISAKDDDSTKSKQSKSNNFSISAILAF